MNESIERRISDQYREVEDEKEIVKYFNTGSNEGLPNFLLQNNYTPFCSITTTRKKYQKDGFGIDLDSMDFGYTLAEIEYMTDDESGIQEVTHSIIKFAEKHSINTHSMVRGKVVEYLRTNNPVHFQALIDAKVIK